jgi:hypothetical protein
MQKTPDDESPFPGKPLGYGVYEVSEEDLKDAVLFRPGSPNFEEMEVAPHERITEQTVLKPVDVVIFYDRFSSHPLSGGCNQWAFVVDDKRALFSRAIVHSISLSKLRKKPNAIAIRRIPEDFAAVVAQFLIRYRWRPPLFKAAINHLQCTNYTPFLTGKFFPDDVSYASDEEYEAAWQKMVASLQPHDAIFTYDRTHPMSKVIAKVTHGPFSHVATYIGDGKIWEIVTSGARIAPLETYKDRHHYRVAAYRHYGFEETPRDQQLVEMQEMVGNIDYGYIGAIGGGLMSYFGNHRDSATPNGLILSGPLFYIGQA